MCGEWHNDGNDFADSGRVDKLLDSYLYVDNVGLMGTCSLS